MMADYDFYVNTYLGTQIQEKEFPPLAAQAASILERFARCYRVTGGQESRAMAICAMAECLHRQSKHPVSAASVGQASVHYALPQRRSLEQQLYSKASIYLDIYRGVG